MYTDEWECEKHEEAKSSEEILEQQSQKYIDAKKQAVNVLKSRGATMRDMADKKKFIVMSDVKEEQNPVKVKRERERYETTKAKSN